MTSDEQEYGALRYTAPRLTILPLSSGGFAVGSGYNPPDLICILPSAEALADFICEAAEKNLHRAQEEGARRVAIAAASDFSLDFDFDAIDLSEIGL